MRRLTPILGRLIGRALAVACMLPALARAEVPVTPPERWLAVEQASLPAAARLYQLARLALPLCAEQRRWGFGPQPLRVSGQVVAHAPTEALRQQAMAIWGVQPGEAVFATVVPGTPWARAGVLPGDRLLNPAEFDPALRSPAAASATYLQRVAEASAGFEARPTRQARVLRQGAELALSVTAEASCAWSFRGIDSQWPYALSGPQGVQATLPLLATLDDAQLTAVLAHEVAHVLRATTDESRRAPVTAARLLVLGSLVDLGANSEVGLGRPDDKALVQADRLALWLLRAQGVALAPYLAAVQALAQRPHGLGEPAYERNRPLSSTREAALQQAVSLFETERKLPLPAGIERSALGALLRDGAALAASAAPAGAASRAPRIAALPTR